MLPAYLFFNPFNLDLQIAGGKQKASFTSDNHLLRSIGGGHRHAVFPAHVVRRPLDISIGCLRFSGKDDVNPLHAADLAFEPFYLVGIEYKNHPHTGIPRTPVYPA